MSSKHRSSASSWRRCPECGSSVKRILRTANDKRRWDAEAWRRFRCRQCDWQGLMPASRHTRSAQTTQPQRGGLVLVARAGRVTALLLLAGALAWGAMVALQVMTGG